MGRRATDQVERFRSKVDRRGPKECWPFHGPVGNRAGHRRFALTYRKLLGEKQVHVWAHRFAYELAKGPIPDDRIVRHKCDDPACVNPAHLILGTYKQNTGDAVQRGRMAHGERHPSAKLTRAQVDDVRGSYARGEKQVDIARRFGITQAAVSAIVTRKNWRRL